MRRYCTYFDHNYLPRGLALYESLRAHGAHFELWVLCLSPECHALLTQLRLPGVHPVSLEDFERADPPLLDAKRTRSIVEYYFTCTPSLVKFVFNHEPAADLVTYLDSDLFFFQSPEVIFTELGAGSIAIIAHRFSAANRHLENTGIYNVGWVSFRRDACGLACLEWWRERCLEWCHDRVEPDRYADQKYLDRWPELFPGTVVLQHKGANLAPWNLINYQITERAGTVFVDEQELVFFHFHGFKQLSRHVFNPHISHFHAKPTRVILRHIFLPYWHALCRAAVTGQAQQGAWLSGGIRGATETSANMGPFKRQWKQWRRNFSLFRGVVRRRYFLARATEKSSNAGNSTP